MEKYIVDRIIGKGSFGNAILVKDICSEQQYVVKKILISKMKANEREVARKEVSVLATLHHPNIVKYRESFEEKGYLHIVMNYCEKGDLDCKISSQKGILFPEDQLMDWFVQISLAIEYVHDRKILHRDIKTQNIFLTSSGTIQLGDFGIAKVLGSTLDFASTYIGTPFYLSPEICENKPYDNKSDVWSLGCVLYEMATLKHPFEADDVKNLELKIIRGSYPPLSPEYSSDLRDLIAKLLQQTPGDRPSVNSILKIPFVQRRASKFLTDDQIQDEFSLTIMHGYKFGDTFIIPRPSPASRPPSANKLQTDCVRHPLLSKPNTAVAPKKYNPANIYGTPEGRKFNDNRSSNDKRQPGSGPRPARSQQDLAKKKQDVIEKEKKRPEEIQKPAAQGPNDRGDYAAYLDKLDRNRNNRQNAPGGAAYKAAPSQLSVPIWNRVGVPRISAAIPIQQAEQNRQLGADAAERPKIYGKFIQQKKDAEMNKKRGKAKLFGNSEADARKKKIEAQRQQAYDKVKQKGRERRELFSKEERMRDQPVQRYGQGVNRPGSALTPRPVPAIGITRVLKAIGSELSQPEPVKSPPGIGMTGALKAIGAQNSPEETRPKSALQLKREEVLKGVNQRGPPRRGWGAPAEKPLIDIKEEEKPKSSRSRWGEKLDDRLKELPLAETASAMEVTSARDQVIVNPGDVAADAASRRQWGCPGSTIMNALKELPIMEGGSTMSSDKSDVFKNSNMACGETISESIIVGAIDFGTTFSGYAFATRNDYKEGRMRVSGNHWQTGSQPGLSLKTPTCILFDPTQKFHSFGGDAEDKYTELAHKDEHIDWFYFKRFKMQLYDKHEIARDFMLEGENGLLMPALKVFSESIKYLRGHLENHLHSQPGIGGFQAIEVDWVLTVPAIWTDPAKQFMREAANLGGIPNSRLILALEPEAASIYCKNLPVDRILSSGGKSTLDVFAAGTQYLVLDAGGGTIDITVQEIKEDGDIKQIYMANGGDWGGVKVDQAFDEFLLNIVGMETMDRFRNEDKADYLNLCREFEVKKRRIRPDSTAKITLLIPQSLTEKFQEVIGVSMKNCFKSNKSISWAGDKLRVDPDTARDFYQESCKQIVQHLGGIFRQTPVAKTDIIIMVGGFSESQMLQEHVKSTFPHKNVIIPQDAGLAVLQGAVQFGFNTKVINPRVIPFTCGVSTNKPFRPRTDPEEKKHIVDDKMYCRDRFGKHVERGQPVEVGEVTDQQVYRPLTDDQQKIILPIYISRNIDPEYTDEADLSYLGDLEVDLSDIAGGREREVLVGMRFGGTIMEVEAKIKSTGEKVKAHFNFLR